MTLKEWRIAMQKCLLDVELIEDLPRARIEILPYGTAMNIVILGKDFIKMKEEV